VGDHCVYKPSCCFDTSKRNFFLWGSTPHENTLEARGSPGVELAGPANHHTSLCVRGRFCVLFWPSAHRRGPVATTATVIDRHCAVARVFCPARAACRVCYCTHFRRTRSVKHPPVAEFTKRLPRPGQKHLLLLTRAREAAWVVVALVVRVPARSPPKPLGPRSPIHTVASSGGSCRVPSR